MSKTLSRPTKSIRPFSFGLSPWSPDFNRFFERFFDEEDGFLSETAAASMDVAETDQTIEVRMDLPGVTSENIDIQIDNNTLTIRGERREESQETDAEKHFHRVERRFGKFSRSVLLPGPVNEAEAVAEFNDGVLMIVLPKTAEARPRKINVK